MSSTSEVASTWKVASAIPGRIRLRHDAIRDQGRAHRIEAELSATHGVIQAHARPLTSGLLVHYDPAAISQPAIAPDPGGAGRAVAEPGAGRSPAAGPVRDGQRLAGPGGGGRAGDPRPAAGQRRPARGLEHQGAPRGVARGPAAEVGLPVLFATILAGTLAQRAVPGRGADGLDVPVLAAPAPGGAASTAPATAAVVDAAAPVRPALRRRVGGRGPDRPAARGRPDRRRGGRDGPGRRLAGRRFRGGRRAAGPRGRRPVAEGGGRPDLRRLVRDRGAAVSRGLRPGRGHPGGAARPRAGRRHRAGAGGIRPDGPRRDVRSPDRRPDARRRRVRAGRRRPDHRRGHPPARLRHRPGPGRLDGIRSAISPPARSRASWSATPRPSAGSPRPTSSSSTITPRSSPPAWRCGRSRPSTASARTTSSGSPPRPSAGLADERSDGPERGVRRASDDRPARLAAQLPRPRDHPARPEPVHHHPRPREPGPSADGSPGLEVSADGRPIGRITFGRSSVPAPPRPSGSCGGTAP